MPDVTPAAGPALDQIIAERLFSWRWAQFTEPMRERINDEPRHRVMLSPPRFEDAVKQGVAVENTDRSLPVGFYLLFSDSPPPFSTDIGAAFQIVERLREFGHTKWQLDGDGEEYAALFSAQRAGMTCEHSDVDSCCCCWEWVQATAPTAPEAICIVALRALALEVPDAGDVGG